MDHVLSRLISPLRAGIAYRTAKVTALRRQRKELEKLSDQILHDIGVTRSEAAEEARRPFWDVPAHWRR
ncbi:MAG: DUF1127 domain-containing protein [Rhodobacteraceae bacterium]|nr:DUF1127 domain-containing protein [Paracoccaceae bacterium]